MKFGKAKLIFSIFSLTAAVALAVFTVYAWFIKFENVSTGGIITRLASGDVISCEIKYYYTTSENGKDYEIGEQINPNSEGNREMNGFIPLLGGDDDTTFTAVLMDMALKFSRAGEYYFLARATHADVYDDKNFDEFIGANYLSNVICMQNVAEEDVNVTAKTFVVDEDLAQYNFITDEQGETVYFDGADDQSKRNSSVELTPYKVAEDATGEAIEHHVYYLLDYIPEQITSLYTIMLQYFPGKAAWDTEITFQQDLVLEIGKKE